MSVSSNSICMCVWEGRMGERERKEKRKKTECGREKNVKK